MGRVPDSGTTRGEVLGVVELTREMMVADSLARRVASA